VRDLIKGCPVPGWRVALSFVAVSACLASPLAGSAQQGAPALASPAQTVTPGPGMSQEEINRQLLDRLKDLEQEVKLLKEQLSAPASAATPVAPVTASPAPAEAAAASAPAPAATVEAVNEVAPRLKLEIFGDVGAQSISHDPDTFLFGSLDLFTTARLSDKISTLGELLFIAENDNSISVDVERLLLRYRQSKYLTATVGRYHTWVGYYNSAYNKAALLETTTDRPFMYNFDDSGGVLPMQDVGVNVTGQIPSGRLGLNYVVELGNGRAWGLNAEPAQSNQDANNSKSINGGLFIRPKRYSGLQAGFSLRHDNLTIPGPSIGETIATAHGVFNDGNYEILNEAAYIRHDVIGGPYYSTNAFYTQFSRAFHAYRPYFRYQYFNAPSTDPVWNTAAPSNLVPADVTGFVGRINGPAAGLRYNFNENSAFKFQYDRIELRALPTANVLNAQFAFSF
jgi:hypothetical protein